MNELKYSKSGHVLLVTCMCEDIQIKANNNQYILDK
jgi:hypothetical protein